MFYGRGIPVKNRAFGVHMRASDKDTLLRGVATVIATVVLVAISAPAQGQKTDVISLRNGDDVTGEIKELEYGLLRFKTDAMKTVYVQWPKVVRVSTDKVFQVVLENGTIYVGSLAPGNGDSVSVNSDSLSVAMATQEVVRLTRIKQGFWDALDGNVDLGFDFTQQNNKTDLTVDAGVGYVAGAGTNRGVSWRSRGAIYTDINVNSTLSRQEGAEDITKFSGSLSHVRQYGGGWFFLGLLAGSRNTQLSLDSRLSVGGGVGRVLVESNRTDLALWLAPAYSREQYAGQPTTTSIPLILSADFLLFIWDPLDVEISASLGVLPVLNESGRWRVTFVLSASKEIVKNVDFSLGVDEYYDSRPPLDGTNQNDFSLTSSFGWSF